MDTTENLSRGDRNPRDIDSWAGPATREEGRELAAVRTEASETLLERDGELARLAHLLDETREGRGGVVTVEGPAGIGKTSLLAAGTRMALERNFECLTARGGELERGFAFGIVRQLLEAPIAALEPKRQAALFEGAGALARPLLAPDASSASAGEESALAVVHGLYWVCSGLAESAPIAIVVDDLHWVDSASLRFLAYLGRRSEGMRLMVLSAARPVSEPERAELIASLSADERAVRLEPAPLGEDSVAAIVRGTLGPAAGQDLCRECHVATGGNPFLAATLATTLADERHATGSNDPRSVPELASRAVSRIVVRRLGRLSEEATALARAVSILGTDADLRHAARLAGLGAEEAGVAADALAAQEVLRVGRPLEFVHPLVRSAVREEIAPVERAAAHARAARLLDAYGREAVQIGAHLLATEPAEDPWVVETLRAAARDAAAEGAPEAAAEYLRRALAEGAPEPDRGVVLRELGAAELRAGQPESAIEHLSEALLVIQSPRERAAVNHDLAVGLVAPGRYEEATQMLERAVEEAAAADRDLALGLEGELLTAATMQPSTYPLVARRMANIELDLDGRTRGQRALMLGLAFELMVQGEDAATTVKLARTAWDRGLLADQGGHSGLVVNAMFCPFTADHFELAEQVSDAALDDVRARRSVIGFARHSCMRSLLRLRIGDVRGAEANARDAIEAGTEAGYVIALMAQAPLVDALVEMGELDEADASLSGSGLSGPIPEAFMLNFVLHSRGWLRLAQGDHKRAVEDFEELSRREKGWRSWNPAIFTYRSGLALALRGSGDSQRARALAAEELERARRWGAPRAVGISLRTAGMVGEDGGALELLGDSVEMLAGTRARLEHARSLVELGAAIRRAGRRSEARDPLASGMELAHACGATALVERARDELRAAGSRPRRIVRTGVDALTPSELRVARMAAEGMTNREIAQDLFVTTRTIEIHLTHAYQKLDISGRNELGAALSP